jgi:hypothetical protein
MQCACSSRQQRWRGCGSKKRVCVRQQAAAAGGTIAMDGRRQRACSSGQRMRCACNSVQRQRRACDSVQRHWRVCGSGRGQPAAQLQWETVMAAANRHYNCNGRRRQQRKGRQNGSKIAIDNGNSDGQLWVKVGVGGHSG